jgi:hypothetical protein
LQIRKIEAPQKSAFIQSSWLRSTEQSLKEDRLGMPELGEENL